jgi:hypothetical protein
LDNEIKNNEIQGSGAEPEGKRPLGRPRGRWDNNINMNLRRTGREGVAWIHLAQNRGTSGDLLPLRQCKDKNVKGIQQFYRLFCVINWRNVSGKIFF